MRRLLGLLRREDEELALAPQPSLRHLDRLAESVRDAGLPVEVEVEGEPLALPPGVDLSAYRIVQEALTNALKHAGPARARVLVRYGRDELELEISDDGPGTAAGRTAAATAWSACASASACTAASSRAAAGPRVATRSASGSRSSRRPMTIRVLVADDQELVRTGLRTILDAQPDIEVVGEAGDGARGGRGGSAAAAGRRGDGHPHAATRRDRGDPAHRRRARTAAARARADHVRPRRVRLRGAAGRRERLPAQGRARPTR